MDFKLLKSKEIQRLELGGKARTKRAPHMELRTEKPVAGLSLERGDELRFFSMLWRMQLN